MAVKKEKQIRKAPHGQRGNGYPVSRDLSPRLVVTASCKPLGRETRKHPPQQVCKLAASLERFGFVLPILVDAETRVVAGWGLVLAARRLELEEVPAVCLSDLSEADVRALRLALNRLAEDSAWDHAELSVEFSEILECDAQIDLTASAFEVGEIDALLDDQGFDEEDELPPMNGAEAVTRNGDLWVLGDHHLLCGDALNADSYDRVLGNEKAQLVFTDSPYNVPIANHASGLGAIKHADFAMASGEMSSAEFQAFLRTALGHAASHSVDGAIHYVCMDWRHLRELQAAGDEVFSALLNLCVWNKSNAGMGSLYRSKHELILVFKVSKAPHINNVGLGRYGRHRTNVWDYLSQNTLSGSRKGKLALHPTVKPVALIADAIRDCSNRGGLILDPFGGAGTTVIAAERTGRRARVIELNPVFVDVSIERWQRLTGDAALHAETGQRYQSNGKGATVDTEG